MMIAPLLFLAAAPLATPPMDLLPAQAPAAIVDDLRLARLMPGYGIPVVTAWVAAYAPGQPLPAQIDGVRCQQADVQERLDGEAGLGKADEIGATCAFHLTLESGSIPDHQHAFLSLHCTAALRFVVDDVGDVADKDVKKWHVHRWAYTTHGPIHTTMSCKPPA